MKRLLLLSLVALAALAAAGCGNKTETAIVGETEGIYVGVDGLTYQVQISRILNPASIDDQGFLRGVPEDEEPTADEVWFGVFMRVENETDEALESTGTFRIRDTQDTEFEPIELDPKQNLFRYQARVVPPGQLIPAIDSPAYDNSIRGALLLFKVKLESLYNRPLELEIESERGGDNAVVDLDV